VSHNSQWAGVVSAFGIGLGVGAALGVLFAPSSGEEARQYVSDAASDAMDSGRKMAKRARKMAEDASDYAKEAAETGAQAFRDARKTSS
jgi:gas vesicle protein